MAASRGSKLHMLVVFCVPLVLLVVAWCWLSLPSAVLSAGPAGTTAAADVLLPNGRLNITQHIQHANANWTLVGRHSEVDTFARKVPDSRIMAFRGVATLDLHISEALSPFVNVTKSLEWVSMLQSIERLPISGEPEDPLVDVIYQVLALPWPVTQRDVLLRREFSFRPDLKQVSICYRSIEDARVPEVDGVIRAVSPHTMWRFTVVDDHDPPPAVIPAAVVSSRKGLLAALRKHMAGVKVRLKRVWKRVQHALRPRTKGISKESAAVAKRMVSSSFSTGATGAGDGFCSAASNSNSKPRRRSRTLVEVESTVDSKGSIPAWFINYMQRYWPAMTLSTFQRLVHRGLVEPDMRVQCW